jgi:precorrin-6B C5,15-methyltransferase / cobalt-precorrin-6B C5,C15-methyltransferase
VKTNLTGIVNCQLSIVNSMVVNYYVVGIPNNPNFILSDEVNLLLQKHTSFSGGKRHYELVKQLLPINHLWIDIAGDMPTLFQKYKKLNQSIIVFASGDPLFYGFVNTIKKNHPDAEIMVYPYFNSLQVLCQKNNISYQNIVNTSIHGRSWEELDVALIQQSDLIGILTDNTKTPVSIAQRMLDYNFSNYKMIVGEALEGENENITSLSLKECTTQFFDTLNCVLLIKEQQKQKQFGIADIEFVGLENRPNMITKMPVRLVSLSQLDLHNKKTFWDIGFCTGSVSIEAKTQFPHLNIIAFEKREECSVIFDVNTCRHSTPGIAKVMGDFFETDLRLTPAPDTVFIGGHGNKLEELIQLVDKYLLFGGRIVMNAVKDESKKSFIKSVERLNYNLLQSIEITIDEHNPITILTAQKN